MADFNVIIGAILENEAGFTDNPKDSGNWTGGKIGAGQLKGTKYGISAASYPAEDIVNLTLDQAKAIYWRDYWSPLNLTQIDSNQVAFKVADIAINMGRQDAARFLQQAVGAGVDGIIGSRTITATNVQDPKSIVLKLCTLQEEHYRAIVAAHPEKEVFLQGWLARALETGDQFT